MMKFNSRNNNIVFSSDLHINHKNFCKGTSSWPDLEHCRDFYSLEGMNSTILKPFWELSENTILFLLGDTLFGQNKDYYQFFDQIPCREIYHINGNHENMKLFKQEVHPKIKWYGDIFKVTIDSIPVIMSHRPFLSWEDMDRTIHLYGHVHGQDVIPKEFAEDRHMKCALDTINPKKVKPMMMDVGIDNYNKIYGEYKYFTWEQIKNILK